MFSGNTLMLNQQNLQLRPFFVKWQLALNQGLARFPNNYLAK